MQRAWSTKEHQLEPVGALSELVLLSRLLALALEGSPLSSLLVDAGSKCNSNPPYPQAHSHQVVQTQIFATPSANSAHHCQYVQ
jgi:hypothetical protein